MARYSPSPGLATVRNCPTLPSPRTGGTNGSIVSGAVGSRFVPQAHSQNHRSARNTTGKSSAGRLRSAAHFEWTKIAAATRSDRVTIA